MRGYAQAKPAAARQKSAAPEPRTEAAAGPTASARESVGAEWSNHRVETTSLVQTPHALDRRPGVQAQLTLQLALNRQQTAPAQTRPSATGLPDRLKAGVEHLSGLAMDDVRVHYNSRKPAGLGALAYTQGTDIHVGPGQERHLPHEAWHVVQQKQGRVKPTLQLKGVTINDDPRLEREADVMAAPTLRTMPRSQGADTPRVDAAAHATPVGAAFQICSGIPVQRKVGFEIEVQNIEVKRGTLLETKEGAKGQEESYAYEASDIGATTPLIAHNVKSYGSENGDSEVIEPEPPKKGYPMHKGKQWRLTPDSVDPKFWYAEFITDPFDETEEAESAQLGTALDDIASYAAKTKQKWFKLENRYLIRRDSEPITGGFHITGGIKIDQLVNLLTQMSELAQRYGNVDEKMIAQDTREEDEDDIAQSTAKEEEKKLARYIGRESKMLARTAENARQLGRSGNYKGLVALVGSYVAGQQLGAKEQGKAAYPKQYLPVMSRTNLGTIVGKVPDMPPYRQFVADVLNAAHLAASMGDQPLFQGVAAGPSNITIDKWLKGIYDKKDDLSFSDTPASGGGAFKFEDVGPPVPVSKCIPWLKTHAKGAIVELRNLRASVPIGKWKELGTTFAQVFKNLNASR